MRLLNRERSCVSRLCVRTIDFKWVTVTASCDTSFKDEYGNW